MSVHDFPNRGPRRMNGMARMLAQAQDLSPLASAAKLAVGPARSSSLAGQLQASIEVLKQITIERQKTANVETCLASFEAQCKTLPGDDKMRKVVEVLLDTLRKAIAAGAEGLSVSVAVQTPVKEPSEDPPSAA